LVVPDQACATFLVEDQYLAGEQITGRLGLQPTRVASRGEPVSRRSLRKDARQHTAWSLDSPYPDDTELECQLRWLLDVLEPARAALGQLQQGGAALRFSCLLTGRPTGNTVWIETGTLARIAALGAALVLGIYDSDRSD
jgi:Domain of unknown function (DUF4279)